jgi:hypothetical protein
VPIRQPVQLGSERLKLVAYVGAPSFVLSSHSSDLVQQLIIHSANSCIELGCQMAFALCHLIHANAHLFDLSSQFVVVGFL